MSVLTLDVGGTNLSVACQRGGHAPPRKVGGDRSYSFSGAETAATRGEAMVVPVVLEPLPPATVATIRALFAFGNQVPCAGDIFNNGGGTSDWSATITDELHETADRVTVSMTLYEVGSVSSFVPATSYFLLTSVDSPDSADPTVLVSTPDGSYPGDFGSGYSVLVSATPATCGCPALPAPAVICATTFSVTPERSWLSVPLNAGIVSGRPRVQIETQGGSATVWGHQSTKAKLYQVRAGVNIAGPFETDYVGTLGGLGSSVQTMTCVSSVVLVLQTGDQLLVEFWSRLALWCGQSDDSVRQFIWYGNVPGPRVDPLLIVGGNITSYP